jgi:hypothetical protein
MPTRIVKVLLALACALVAPLAHAGYTFSWHGDCVDRYLGGYLAPDIGGCAAVNGIVSGAIGVPDEYVLGTSYDFQFGPTRPTFILNDPFFPMSDEMFGSGGIDFTIVGGVPVGQWWWLHSNLSSMGGTGDMYFNIDYTTTSVFHVAATNVVFDSLFPLCDTGPGAVCPTPGTLPLALLGLLLAYRQRTKRTALR